MRSSSLSSHCLLDPRLTSPAGLLDYSIVMAKICLCLIKQLVKSNITKTFSLYKSPYFHLCFSGRKKLEVNQINNFILINFCSSSQTAASYIIRNPQPRHSSQSQPVRGRDEEQDDIVSADVEEVRKEMCSSWCDMYPKMLCF